jgi:hypothetical protein
MKQYDWSAWTDRIKSFTGKWALERWFLMYLHEQDNIDALALEIKARLAAEGRFAEVQVQSIWVDGTPQAEFSPKGHLPGGKKPQCELADLLLCVRWESSSGLLQREQAMLIQAKIAIKYNELPGGKSTRKERLLFETCNRHKNITLYPGVNRGNPIGTYQLGSSTTGRSYGLRDCASFLLMAKGTWPVATAPVGPLQVGWPVGKTKVELTPPDSYLDAVISMVSGAAPTMGREVKTGASAVNCVWTKMVNDLRGKYWKVNMSGYNEQARVTSASTASTSYIVYSLLDKVEYFSDFVLRLQEYFFFEPRFLRWFGEGDWWRARRLKLRIDPNDSKGPDFIWEFMAHFDLADLDDFDLWRRDPVDPPPQDWDFKDDNGPYISTQLITIRGVDEYRRRD